MKDLIPNKDKTSILHKKIQAMYMVGFSYDEIKKELKVSKTTISFVLKGRNKKSKIKN